MIDRDIQLEPLLALWLIADAARIWRIHRGPFNPVADLNTVDTLLAPNIS